MPVTYQLISSNVLSSSAASVTFSSIPATYTDLVLRYSARGASNIDTVKIEINADSTVLYSYRSLQGDGSAASSSNDGGGDTQISVPYGVVNSTKTASTFSSGEIYIPNYTVAQNRQIGTHQTQENNGTSSGMAVTAGLYRSTTTITSVTLSGSGGSFAAGSSFYLYGIKNS